MPLLFVWPIVWGLLFVPLAIYYQICRLFNIAKRLPQGFLRNMF